MLKPSPRGPLCRVTSSTLVDQTASQLSVSRDRHRPSCPVLPHETRGFFYRGTFLRWWTRRPASSQGPGTGTVPAVPSCHIKQEGSVTEGLPQSLWTMHLVSQLSTRIFEQLVFVLKTSRKMIIYENERFRQEINADQRYGLFSARFRPHQPIPSFWRRK
jgi:hypothetical protein